MTVARTSLPGCLRDGDVVVRCWRVFDAAAMSAALTAPGVTHTEIHHDERNFTSAGVPRRLGYERVAIEPDAAPPPPAASGVSWVWRMTPERWAGAVPAQTV